LPDVLIPSLDLDRVEEAHARLVHAIATLDDESVRRPSLLPGWSVGHVLTHLARNADSHVRRAAAASAGELVDQYEGGTPGRAAEIEAGAGRPAHEIAEDVRATCAAVDHAWRNLAVDAWPGRSRDASGQVRRLFELPSRRWQEVEVHLVDLGLGFTPLDWPETFVVEWLPRTRERLWAQLPDAARTFDFGTPTAELAWLYGRAAVDGLGAAPAWG
jgi:maleylpyruvate isomerase